MWLYLTAVAGDTTTIRRVTQVNNNMSFEPLGSLATGKHLNWVAWDTNIYVINEEVTLHKLYGKSLTLISTSDTSGSGGKPNPAGSTGYRKVCARYAVNADDHLMLGNLSIDGTAEPLMLVWSDLYDPENFVVSSGTEAGFYNVRSTEQEIMGLAYSKGYTNILTRNSIMLARYVGYDAGLFDFTTLSNSIGCRYHGSVVQAKDAVFFIGKDNFYSIDGANVAPIGQPVWKFFDKTNFSIDDSIFGYLSEQDDIVFWKFRANGNNGTISGAYYDLMFNYVEQKWSLRESEGILDYWSSQNTCTTAITCDEISSACNSFTEGSEFYKCSDFVRSFSYTKLFLVSSGLLQENTGRKDGINGAGRDFFLETGDMVFSAVDAEVHLDEVRLFMSHNEMLCEEAASNSAYIEVAVGYKLNSSDTFHWTDYVRVTNERFDKRDINFRFRKYNISGKVFRLRIRARELGSSYLNTISTCQLSIDIPNEQEANYVTR